MSDPEPTQATKSKKQHEAWLALSLLALIACDPSGDTARSEIPDGPSGRSELVRHVAHGEWVGDGQRRIEPSLRAVRDTQDQLIAELETIPGSASVDREFILETVSDPLLADAFYIDQLLNVVDAPGEANSRQVNGVLRDYYLSDRGGVVPSDTPAWARGLSAEAARLLDAGGRVRFSSIGSAGQDYIDDCRLAGVPVPDLLFDPDDSAWVNHELMDFTFLNDFANFESELWSWESNDPDGICLALPRWREKPGAPGVFEEARTLGFICWGRSTGKACFFDDPFVDGTGVEAFPRDQVIPISALIGGTDLVEKDGGVCTACHAGENPFVVHPDMDVFHDLVTSGSLTGGMWHDPLVDGSWVQNPGPMPLPPVSDGVSCASCHNADAFGRLPLVTHPALDQYCGVVINALRDMTSPPIMSPRTMPPKSDAYGFPESALDPELYDEHSTLLETLCLGTISGDVTPGPGPADDLSVLSPPILGELYACGNTIRVSGVRLGATVNIYLNGDSSPVASASPGDVDTFELILKNHGLVANDGDSWAARQFVTGSSPSGLSNSVDVVEYPEQLAPPTIGRIHQCSDRVYVRAVPGATIDLIHNSGSPIESIVPIVSVGTDLDPGDSLIARQRLCDNVSDYMNVPVVVRREPNMLRELRIEPLTIYEQQILLNVVNVSEGATIDFTSSMDGTFGQIASWPISNLPRFSVNSGLGRGFKAGEQIELEQSHCDVSSTWVTDVALPCSALPAPNVLTPLNGQNVVSTINPIPGATIRVWDAAGEIGDGSGTTIRLTRDLVSGDNLRIMQNLAGCRANTHFTITVP